MSHKRKDTYVPTVEWWKHLRPFYKKLQSRLERVEAKKMIDKEKKGEC